MKQVVITISGGMVVSVQTRGLEPLDIIVVDYDIDYSVEEERHAIPQDFPGMTQDAMVYDIVEEPLDPEFFSFLKSL